MTKSIATAMVAALTAMTVYAGAGMLGGAADAAACAEAEGAECAAACPGDCDGDGAVRINELVLLVRVALDLEELSACAGSDRDADGSISIEELIAAVDGSLNGCPVVIEFTGFEADDVLALADDDLDGRDNDTPGSAAARQYIIDQIRGFAAGLDSGASGDDAYLQPFDRGTNVLGVIPGGELADEYVIVGAHYDHLGGCSGVCNGATDNAAGVAAVLAIGRSIAAIGTPPRRSVVLAFWDREEDGLLGSSYYVNNPPVPLADTIAYLNFDIQGANLLPSLRKFSFAVGAETGGDLLLDAVAEATARVDLDIRRLSQIFGQGRSDYVWFIRRQIPTVFFSDSTGPCYHTAADDVSVVDFDKLAQQSESGFHLTYMLTETDTPPSFAMAPLVVFPDATRVLDVIDAAVASDLDLFGPTDRAALLDFQSDLAAVVAEGEANFGDDDIGALAAGVAGVITNLSNVPCDGFLEP